jgi:hypothetical protein
MPLDNHERHALSVACLALVSTIDELTELAFNQVALNQFDDCVAVLSQRSVVISDLVSHCPNVIDKESLSLYLSGIKKCDHHLIKILNQQKTLMQDTLSNFSQIRQYLKV